MLKSVKALQAEFPEIDSCRFCCRCRNTRHRFYCRSSAGCNGKLAGYKRISFRKNDSYFTGAKNYARKNGIGSANKKARTDDSQRHFIYQ